MYNIIPLYKKNVCLFDYMDVNLQSSWEAVALKASLFSVRVRI